MSMTLTPIGTSPAWYNPGEPSSGFLVEHDGYRVLIDCGSGVMARYLELFGAEQPLDAIYISHVHADHCFDIVPLKFGIDLGTLRHWRPRLLLPPEGLHRLSRLVSTWDHDASFFTDTFDVASYIPGNTLALGPISARTLEVPHYIRSFALRLEAGDVSLGYSADLGPTPDIGPFMRNVDLLLAEACLPEDADLSAPGRGHITAREAGVIARDARAARLMLTHVPQEVGYEVARGAAAHAFGRTVEIAESGAPVRVSPGAVILR